MSSEKMDLVTNRLAEVAPDFARLVIEYAFGTIFSRDVLDMRSRELIAISVLTARGDSIAPLRAHISSALKFGISQAEVVESMMQVSIYSGFPVVINALTACHDLLTKADDPNCMACPDPVQSTEVGHS
jgi:4-carboxymuconolactone decarboxylase